MKTIHKGSEIMKCPHCGAEQDDPVSEFAVALRTGPSSKAFDSCWDCRKRFSVTKLDEDKYEVDDLK